MLEKCEICPHRCGVNRQNGIRGKCGANDKIKVALASIHYYEEPCISGKNGSGTIFFSNCNLNCMFCQNYEISHKGIGTDITVEDLAKIFINQQRKGVNNINLVTPTMYIYQMIEAIKIAKRNGLKIPIVYNTNAYERVESLKLLEGYVDIYLPDLKYAYNMLAKKYSKIDNYFEYATNAIKEMYRQVGKVQMDENGIMKKGMIIRHLILPGYIQNTKKVLEWIKDNFDDDVLVSVMAQYFPTYKAKEDKIINRKVNLEEYRKIEEYLSKINIKNGYMQELGEHEEEYVPDFNKKLEI